MTLVTLLIFLNVIFAYKTRNSEANKGTYEDFDGYITHFGHRLNTVDENTEATGSTKGLSVLKNEAEGSVEIQSFVPNNKIKRCALEENEVLAESTKPIRRVRHRNKLKQDPSPGKVNNTTTQLNLQIEEVPITINDTTNKYGDIQDDMTNETNADSHQTFGDMLSAYLDMNKDILIRSLELNSLANRNFTVQNSKPISSIIQNNSIQLNGVIEMPSKYISIVEDHKAMAPNANDEITSTDIQMPAEDINLMHIGEIAPDQGLNLLSENLLETNKNVYQNFLNAKRLYYVSPETKNFNDGGSVAEKTNVYSNQPYNTYQKIPEEKEGYNHQYFFESNDNYTDENKNRPNFKSFRTNGRNVYHKFNEVRPGFANRQLMGRSGAGFEEEYYEDYSDYMHRQLEPGNVDYQENMKDNSAKFVTAQYEGYPIQPNIYQKLLKAGQGYHQQEQIEDNRNGHMAAYHNSPYDIHQKVSQGYNHKEPMDRDDPRIITALHHKDPYQTNIKSLERNEHVRPEFEKELESERSNAGLIGEKQNKMMFRHPSKEHSYQNILDGRPNLHHKELVEKYDARAKNYNSPTIPFLMNEPYPIQKLSGHQEFMKGKHTSMEDYYNRQEPNSPHIPLENTNINGNNLHEKLLETRPQFDHFKPLSKSFHIGEDLENDPNKQNTKASEIDRNTYRQIKESKPIFNDPEFMESNNNRMLLEDVHGDGYGEESSIKIPNINNLNIVETKNRLIPQNFEMEHPKTFFDSFKEPNENTPFIESPISHEEVEDMRKPTQKVIEKNISDVGAPQQAETEDFNPNTNQNMSEVARNGPEKLEPIRAEPKHDTKPEEASEPKLTPLESINSYTDELSERNARLPTVKDIAKPVYVDENRRGVVGIISRSIQVPRRQSLVVLPRFGCRLVPLCNRLYLRRRCTKLIRKCGIM